MAPRSKAIQLDTKGTSLARDESAVTCENEASVDMDGGTCQHVSFGFLKNKCSCGRRGCVDIG